MKYIAVKFNNRLFAFRPCDTNGMTREQVQKSTDETGRMQYEPTHAWLVVDGVGYGWETTTESMTEWANENGLEVCVP